jgi:hypothetical protein
MGTSLPIARVAVKGGRHYGQPSAIHAVGAGSWGVPWRPGPVEIVARVGRSSGGKSAAGSDWLLGRSSQIVRQSVSVVRCDPHAPTPLSHRSWNF